MREKPEISLVYRTQQVADLIYGTTNCSQCFKLSKLSSFFCDHNTNKAPYKSIVGPKKGLLYYENSCAFQAKKEKEFCPKWK
jgi:hypothetical protein